MESNFKNKGYKSPNLALVNAAKLVGESAISKPHFPALT